MADNTHTIEVGETQFVVPKWATEETLIKIEKLIGESGIVTSLVERYMKQTNIDVSKLSDDIQDYTLKTVTGNAKVEKAKKESFDKKLLGAAKSTKNVVDKFSNTDTPLTAMTDMLGDMGNAISGSVKGMRKDTKNMSSTGEVLDFAGKSIAGLGAGGLMWAAFQAGQIEQFAKAQETMINSGAIMFSDTSPYETLKQSAIASGLTYTELSKVVSQNGIALQSLGNGVSSGTTAFVSMFKSVNNTGDKFGDYGLRSAEMAEVLADYVNIQRMTSSKDMALLGTQDGVEAGFHNLMIETTALASLTGQNRSELLQKRMAALAEPQVAAALKRMKEHGGGHAEVAESMIGQFALLESSMGPVGKNISDMFNSYLFKKSDNMEDFNLNEAFVDTKFAGAIEGLNHGFIEKVNDAMKSGDVDGANNLIVNGLAEMRNGELGSSNAIAGSLQDVMHQLAVAGNSVHVAMKEMRKMTAPQYEEYLKQIEKKLETSGEITVSMNKMKTAFMTIQDSFVLNLDEASEMAETLAIGIKEGAETMKDTLNAVTGKVQSVAVKVESVSNVTSALMDDDDVSLAQTGLYSLTAGLVSLMDLTGSLSDIKNNAEDTGTSRPDLYRNQKPTPAQSATPPAQSATPPADDKRKEQARQRRLDREQRKVILEKRAADRLSSLSTIPQRQFGGPVTKDKPYIVGEKGAELFTPTSHGSITDTNKTKMKLDNPNTGDNNMSLHLDDIIKTKKQTVAVLNQMKAAMKSIQRSNDYKRAVDNTNKTA